MTEVPHWSPGDTVVWRTGRDGKVWSAHPMTVVRDTPELVALCIRPGTVIMRRSGTRGGPRGRNLITWDGGHEPRTWQTHTALLLNRPGDEHSIHVYWNEQGVQRSWYVNLEAPWRRSAVGFDSEDRDLDVVIEPDLSAWHWKDEDELAFAVERGRFTEDDVVAFRAEGERAVQRVLRREPPLDEPWERWRPDPAWPLPTLPDGWDRPWNLWRAGDTVVMRDVHGDRVRFAIPCRVVQDETDVVVLYIAPGTRWMRPRARWGGPRDRVIVEWDGTHEELVWSGEGKLAIFRPGAGHSVQVFWDNRTSEFLGWYVNLERHLGRTRVGHDIQDQVLDLIIYPDLERHEWKDEDEIAYLVELGLMRAEDAAAARAEGERVLESARRRERPFSEDWPSWRPDPAWPVPALPRDWATL